MMLIGLFKLEEMDEEEIEDERLTLLEEGCRSSEEDIKFIELLNVFKIEWNESKAELSLEMFDEMIKGDSEMYSGSLPLLIGENRG